MLVEEILLSCTYIFRLFLVNYVCCRGKIFIAAIMFITDIPTFSKHCFPSQLLSTSNAKIEARLGFSLRLNVSVDIEKSFFGGAEAASIGLLLQGSLDSSLEISISKELRFAQFSSLCAIVSE